MQVNLVRGEGPNGQVNYTVKMGDDPVSGAGGHALMEEEDVPKLLPQAGKPVKIHTHTRIFSIGDISVMNSTFECRFDLYLNWPEQIEGACEYALEVRKLSWQSTRGFQ